MIDILITILVVLIIFAVVAYVINNYIPLDPGLRQLVMLILGVILLIWILLMFTGHAGYVRLGGPR